MEFNGLLADLPGSASLFIRTRQSTTRSHHVCFDY